MGENSYKLKHMIKSIKKSIKWVLGYNANNGSKKINKTSNYIIMNNSILSGFNEIGDHTYIGFNCIITKSKVGRYCSIANNVSIGIGEHKINRVSTSSIFYKNTFETLTEGECVIGNDVWIGSNAVIRRGVTIGNGAVIGANSFVNKNVLDFEIVGGTPAKHIKMRFNDLAISEIQKVEWWKNDLEEARTAIEKIEQTGLFELN